DVVGVIEQVHLILDVNDIGTEQSIDAARCGQQRVNLALGDVLVVDDLDGRSIEYRDPRNVGLARRGRVDVDEVGGGGREREIAGDVDRANRVWHAGRQCPPSH